MRDRLYKRGKVWWGWYDTPTGELRRVSTKCTDREAARLALRNFERGAQGQASVSAHTVQEALDYLIDYGLQDKSEGTVRMYTEKGGHLVRLLGTRRLSSLNQDDVREYIKSRLDDGAARSTVSKELVTLRAALKEANRRGHFPYDPRSIIPAFKVRYVPRDRYLTLDQFTQLLSTLNQLRQLWVLLAVYTGGRDSEIDSLTYEDIDWKRKTIRIRGTKTAGSDRPVPLHPLLAEVLRKQEKRSGLIVGEWLNVRRDLGAACDRVKVPRVTPNDLRRTFATWLKQAGTDSAVVAKLLGHASTKMVDLVYGRLDEATLRRGISALPGHCENSVKELGPAERPEGPPVPNPSTTTDGKSVLGKGIEPLTRGFSIREPRKRTARKRWGKLVEEMRV
jgi:integrase